MATSPTTGSIVGSFRKDWNDAGNHFAEVIGEGELSEIQYNTWIGQHRYWFSGIDNFWKNIIQKAPETDRKSLKRAWNLCKDQVKWFDREIDRLRIDTPAQKLPQTYDFIEKITNLTDQGYPIQILGIWAALELNHRLWERALEKGHVEKRVGELCSTFGTDSFESLCRDIGIKADIALKEVQEDKVKIYKQARKCAREITEADKALFDVILTPNPV